MPEISVIMSTYNEKLEHLHKAITSVQKQTFKDFEFIIILDNPQNHVIRNCIHHYAQNDARIRIIENETNIGLTQSLNKAIKTANGIYMARMDADDIMAKTCLERELSEIKRCHLDFVSASKINSDENGHKLGTYINDFSPEQMKKLTDELREEFDYILLDCPAGIEQGFKNAIAGASRAVVVTTPEVSAIRDADRIIGLLEANDVNQIELIINRIRPDMIQKGDMMSVDDVIEILAIRLLGIVPDDQQIVIATNQGVPLSGNHSPAEQGYLNICRRITGEEVPFLNFNLKKGIFRKMTELFRN